MYHFLQEDFSALLETINELRSKMRSIGVEMGRSCREGAETFHDNFAYEEGTRQQQMLSTRMSEFQAVLGNSTVVQKSNDNTHVGIGRTVRVTDLTTNTVLEIKIGSYMVFSEDETISYMSPLARIIIGAKKGERRNGTISGMKVSYRVEEIR